MDDAGASDHVLIVGAGVFGLTGALALRERGYRVTVLAPEAVPHPKAASNDISRMVRGDYGTDLLYARLAADAIAGWGRWNARWDDSLYHPDGLLLLSSGSLEESSYEGDSFRTLRDDGWPLERLSPEQVATRFPVWNSGRYRDGYFNPRAGWAEAANVIGKLAAEPKVQGVRFRRGAAGRLIRDGGRIKGVITEEGDRVEADHTVVATGVWTPTLLPELDGFLRLSGQPILYFRPADPEAFGASVFPPWGADLAQSGWYGFPANEDGVVKIGHHGPGYDVSADAPRVLPDDRDEIQCRRFLADALPDLAEAPMPESKMCVYTDTWDGNFLISRHPETAGLTVATGGSGHGFKFAPVLGGLIADAMEGRHSAYLDRFAWRPVGDRSTEAARFSG